MCDVTDCKSHSHNKTQAISSQWHSFKKMSSHQLFSFSLVCNWTEQSSDTFRSMLSLNWLRSSRMNNFKSQLEPKAAFKQMTAEADVCLFLLKPI